MSKAPRQSHLSAKAIVAAARRPDKGILDAVAAARRPDNGTIDQVGHPDVEAFDITQVANVLGSSAIKKIANRQRVMTTRRRIQVTFGDEYNFIPVKNNNGMIKEVILMGRGKSFRISSTSKRKLDAVLRELSDQLSGTKILGATKTEVDSDVTTAVNLDENLYPLALEIFGSDEEILIWLKEPNVFLGNECPADIMKTENGVERVLTYLSKIESGTYV